MLKSVKEDKAETFGCDPKDFSSNKNIVLKATNEKPFFKMIKCKSYLNIRDLKILWIMTSRQIKRSQSQLQHFRILCFVLQVAQYRWMSSKLSPFPKTIW